jgi:outer membrane protein assembly factor BamB
MVLADPSDIPNASVAQPFKAPLSRFPAGMSEVPVPDDSESSRQAAITRLRKGARHPVCPGVSNEVPTHWGTACGTREFEAPPLLEAPKLQWLMNVGWYSANPFVLVGNRLFVISCGMSHEAHNALSAFDTKTGKVVWSNKQLCEGVLTDREPDRVFALPNEVLMVAMWRSEGYRQFQVDMKTGKLLSEQKKVMYLWNVELFGSNFVSHNLANKGTSSFIAAQDIDRGLPLWKTEGFVGDCRTWGNPERCISYRISNFAFANGILYASAASKSQAVPARQLHAIDMQSGKVLWKHTEQPIVYKLGKDEYKPSNDTSPMVVDGKVIIRVEGQLGWVSHDGFGPGSVSFRALDARTGEMVWTTDPIPTSFDEEWLPRGRLPQKSQDVGVHLVAGNMLVTMVTGKEPGHREVWAYRLSDGRPAWRRSFEESEGDLGMGASAGGVLYLMSLYRYTKMALDAETGTRLWTFSTPTDPDSPDYYYLLPGRKNDPIDSRMGEIDWSYDWVIGPDGAFYGIRPQGPFKLR